MKRSLIAGVMAALALAGCSSAPVVDDNASAQLPEQIQSAGVLRVGGPANVAPYMSVDDNGNRSGLAYDLISAVAENLGVRAEFSDLEYAVLVPAISSARVDVGIGTLTDTEERERVLDFVDFIKTEMVLIGKSDNPTGITSLTDLCGKRVATPTGTTSQLVLTGQSEECAAAGQPAIELTVVPSPSAAQLQVENGRADAFIQAYGAGALIEKSDIGLSMLGEPFRPEYHGAAVRKGNTELANALNQGFADLIADGTYQELLEKYDLARLALPEPIINGQTTQPLG